MLESMRTGGVVACVAGAGLLAAGWLAGCGEVEPVREGRGEAREAAPETETEARSPEAADPEAALLVDERRLNGWLVIVRWDTPEQEQQRIEIEGEEGVVWSLAGYRISLGSGPRSDGRGDPRIGIGEDVTGDGVPDLIVRQQTDEGDCCVRYAVLALDDDDVREVATLEGGRLGAFADLDGDGLAEFVTSDEHWAGWNASPEDSPAPQMIYKFTGEAYEPAVSLMRAPAPLSDSLDSRAEALREDPEWEAGRPSPAYWGAMLELVYTGHEDAAWRLGMMAWPEGVDGRDEFLNELRSHLEESPAWPAVQAVNRAN